MAQKTKLELTWIGKEIRPRLEPRILLEDAEKSYHAAEKVTEKDIFDNRLIFGDNLLALKALEQEFSGKVKCVFIDPPYNTGYAFAQYDDGLEHSIWLSMMRDRLELLWKMLTLDGSLWISIDDREMPYLRILLDELCGRDHFVASNIWQKRYSCENREAIGDAHEYIVVYAKDSEAFKRTRGRVPLEEKSLKVYKNLNNDLQGPWRGIPMTAQGFRPNQMYPITTPAGVVHTPPPGRCWSTIESEYLKLRGEGRIYFGKDGKAQPSIIRYLSEVDGHVPWTWWPHDEVGHTDEAKKESMELFGGDQSFPTPKPERLIYRVLAIATKPGDFVLDSFAGSGTTGAVAHNMGRRWIMVELGEHIDTHIVPRMVKVVNGNDPGGITEAVDWKGGGGFRYYRLAPSLITKDRFGNPIIGEKYNAAMLAEAMCKLMGYEYAPNELVFWQHGRATESDYLYVTTQTLTHEQLAQLSEEVGEGRTLHVCCSAYRGKPAMFGNLTVEKIPSSVLNRCEWGHDDYSLQVANLPQAKGPEGPPQMGLFGPEKVAR